MADERIVIKIDGDTTSIDRSLDSTQSKTDKTRKSADKLTRSFEELKVAAVAGFGALTAGAAVSIKNFAKFENELLGVKTLLNESSFGAKGLEKGFQDMSKELLQLGKTAPVEISSLNKALFDTVSAGVDAADAVEAVAVSAKLATAGLTDVSIATDGITSALNAYSLNADEAESVAAKFFTAQKAGKTTIAELSAGFGLVGSSASAFGVSLDELLAAVSAVTTAGVKTNAAYTGLKAVLANVAKPTEVAAKEAKRLGVEFDSSALRAKGLQKFLKDLTTAQGFNSESAEKLFGSTEAVNIAFALTGKQAKNFEDVLGTLGDTQQTAKTFNDAYTTSLKSTENQLKIVGNQIQILSVGVGEKLAPALITAVKYWTELLGVTKDVPKSISQVNSEIEETEKLVERLTEVEAKGFNALEKFAGREEDIKLRRIDAEQKLIELIKQRKDLEAIDNQKGIDEAQAEFDESSSELDKEDEIANAKLLKKEEEAILLAEKQAEIDELERLAKQEQADALEKIEKGRIQNEDEAKRSNAIDDLKASVKENNLRLKEEARYGKNQAKAMAFFRTKNVEGFGMMLDNLATLGESGNKTLSRIAQTAAVARAFMNTAEGITKALSYGPILGPILATTVAAAGAVQIASIKSQKFAQGGLVTGGIPGQDSVPAMLQQGELVVPRENFNDVISRFGGETDEDARQQVDVNINLSENLIDFVEAELAERNALDTGVV